MVSGEAPLLKSHLQQRATAEGLSNVVFHAPVNKARLAGLMASTDVGLQVLANIPAFYYGTSPNKLFDYIASGLPVLINYPDWVAEVVREHGCGYVVHAADPKGFAEALIHAASHRSELPQMGQRGRALAQRQFDRRILSVRFAEWLELAAS